MNDGRAYLGECSIKFTHEEKSRLGGTRLDNNLLDSLFYSECLQIIEILLKVE